MTRTLAAAAFTAAASLTGCALAIATPSFIDVMDVRLTGIDLTEQRLA